MKKAWIISSLSLGLSMGVASADGKIKKEGVKNENDPNLKAMLLGNKEYHPQTWLEKGRVLYLSAKYPEAIQAFYKATRVEPKSASAWFNLGASYFQNRQYDEALISFIEANQIEKSEKYMYHACLSSVSYTHLTLPTICSV